MQPQGIARLLGTGSVYLALPFLLNIMGAFRVHILPYCGSKLSSLLPSEVCVAFGVCLVAFLVDFWMYFPSKRALDRDNVVKGDTGLTLGISLGEGIICVCGGGGGLPRHATLATPPSRNCVQTQRTMPQLVEERMLVQGTGCPLSTPPQSPQALASMAARVPLCGGLGKELSSTCFLLSDSTLFW